MRFSSLIPLRKHVRQKGNDIYPKKRVCLVLTAVWENVWSYNIESSEWVHPRIRKKAEKELDYRIEAERTQC